MRVEPRFREIGEASVSPRDARVGDRREPARLVNDSDDFLRRDALPRHVRRPALFEKPAERVFPRLHVARRQQRCGHLWSADALPARGRGEDRRRIDRNAQLGESIRDLDDPARAVGALAVSNSPRAGAAVSMK